MIYVCISLMGGLTSTSPTTVAVVGVAVLLLPIRVPMPMACYNMPLLHYSWIKLQSRPRRTMGMREAL